MATTAGYLGPEGSYSFLAAQKLCGGAKLVAYPSFRALFSALSCGELGAIVVPVENTLNGAVVQNLDLLEEYKEAFATDKCDLQLDHRLIYKEGANLSEITDVYSHPQALEQCSKFLAGKMPHAKLHETSSTVECLAKIKGSTCAGIVGAHVEVDGLVHTDYCISDENTNYTTFLKVVRGSYKPSGKTVKRVFFTLICRHEAGALCNILSVLADYGINMTKIESRPIKDRLNEFRFFIEIQSDYVNAHEALQKIRAHSLSFKLLGAY